MSNISRNQEDIHIFNEINDVREFVELFKKLSNDEKRQVKNIILGIQIARETNSEAKEA